MDSGTKNLNLEGLTLALLDYPEVASPDGVTRPAVLVVDDNERNLAAMSAVLEPLACRVVLARSGMEALRRVQGEEFACILLDVQMPEMDGFETAKLIHAREMSRHVPILFVTAIHQTQGHVTLGYSLGAVDYLFKPVAADLLRTKVRVFVDLFERNRRVQREVEWLQEQERRREAAHSEYRRFHIEQELEYARSIQSRILTQDFTAEGLNVFAHVQPASAVGGDFYDLLPAPGSQTFTGMVGDVMGRGMPAALCMVMVLTHLREIGLRFANPEDILHRTNDRICRRFTGPDVNLVSCGVFSINLRRHTLRYSAAGHEPLLLWQRQANRVLSLEPNGLLLGAACRQTYPSQSVPFVPGDRLLCYTDGISEARSPQGELFGRDRLAVLMARHATAPLATLGQEIRHAIEAFEGESNPSDDSCIFIVECAR